MHLHPRVYLCIIYKKTKAKFAGEHHVVWIGKTNEYWMSIGDIEKDKKTTDNNKYSKSYQTISPNKLIKHLRYRTKKNEMCVHSHLFSIV